MYKNLYTNFYLFKIKMSKKLLNITLSPLEPSDGEQFIKDTQESFKYGATEEFGMRDNHLDKEGQTISRKHLIECLDKKNAVNYRMILDNKIVGGLILNIDKEKKTGELDILFVNKNEHSKGIGTSAWMAVEKMYPEIELWISYTPYFEKRNIHFYINVLGFHAAEFHHTKNTPKNEDGEFRGPEEFFKFEKRIKKE